MKVILFGRFPTVKRVIEIYAAEKIVIDVFIVNYSSSKVKNRIEEY